MPIKPRPTINKETPKETPKEEEVVEGKLMGAEGKGALAFDGSPMPTKALPAPRLNQNMKAAWLQAMRPMKAIRPPCMGLIYGDVGTKKTTVAMEIMKGIVQEGEYILYIDSAQGWTTLMNFEGMIDDYTMQADFENIESLQELAKLINAGEPPFNKIGGIIFDEYTSMHDMDLNWIVQARADQAAKDGGFKDRFTPALPDYNAARIRSNETIQLFMKSKIHLIFIGHSRVTKKLENVPDMPEKAGKALYTKLHFAYYTYTDKEGKWKMQTVNGNRTMAKNRINGIGNHTTSVEFIEKYNKWGGKQIEKVVPEPIPNEDIPDSEEDLEALLK